jgi:hypothetical protein
VTEFVLSEVMLRLNVRSDGPFWQWENAPKVLEVRTFSNTGEFWIGFLAFCVADYAEYVLCVNDEVVHASETTALVNAGSTLGGDWFHVPVAPGQFYCVSLRVRGEATLHQRLLHVRDTPPVDALLRSTPVGALFG